MQAEHPALTTANDAWTLVLTMANAPVQITNQVGKRETMTALEARILELASGDCRRRLFCQDFIALVRRALGTDPATFNAATDRAAVERLAGHR